MGFTDKLAGMLKKKEVKKRESVSFGNLESFIEEKTAQVEENILDESVSHVEGIQEGTRDLSRFLERLKEMERQEMFKRLDRIVKNSQKRFAESLKNVVTRIHLGSQTYDGLELFYNDVSDALQQIQKLNAMHGKYLHLAFDREMKEFSKTAKEIAVYNRMLGDLIETEGEELNTLQEIHSFIKKKNSLEEEIEKIDDIEKKSRERIKTLESDIDNLRSALQEAQSSEAYQEFHEAESRKENLSSELKSIEGEIYNILHPLDRDFRKFKRQVELGHFSFDLNLLESYEQFTEQFLKEKEGYPRLKKIAQGMKEALEKQVIKEKGHKREKILDILHTILQDGLVELQNTYHATENRLHGQVIDDHIVEEIQEMKGDVEEKKSTIEELRVKIEENARRREEIAGILQEVRETIEDRCSEVGIDIE
jgi:chromosome segregation ATPase